MRQIHRCALLPVMTFVLLCVTCAAADPAPGAKTLDERVMVLKTSLAQSQAVLKSYEWVETTEISLKGEQKSRTMKRCYYGDDGAVQKTPISTESEGKAPRGIRGKIAEKKKEELTDYMQEAVALIGLYVPPNPQVIQQCKDAGNATVSIADPGKPVRFEFKSYRVPGDLLAIAANGDSTPASLRVSTNLGSEKDEIQLDVTFAKLKDQTAYPSNIVLRALAKDLTVSVTNSGYVKMNR